MDFKMLGNGQKFDLPAIIKDSFQQEKISQIWLYWYADDGTWVVIFNLRMELHQEDKTW